MGLFDALAGAAQNAWNAIFGPSQSQQQQQRQQSSSQSQQRSQSSQSSSRSQGTTTTISHDVFSNTYTVVQQTPQGTTRNVYYGSSSGFSMANARPVQTISPSPAKSVELKMPEQARPQNDILNIMPQNVKQQYDIYKQPQGQIQQKEIVYKSVPVQAGPYYTKQELEKMDIISGQKVEAVPYKFEKITETKTIGTIERESAGSFVKDIVRFRAGENIPRGIFEEYGKAGFKLQDISTSSEEIRYTFVKAAPAGYKFEIQKFTQPLQVSITSLRPLDYVYKVEDTARLQQLTQTIKQFRESSIANFNIQYPAPISARGLYEASAAILHPDIIGKSIMLEMKGQHEQINRLLASKQIYTESLGGGDIVKGTELLAAQRAADYTTTTLIGYGSGFALGKLAMVSATGAKVAGAGLTTAGLGASYLYVSGAKSDIEAAGRMSDVAVHGILAGVGAKIGYEDAMSGLKNIKVEMGKTDYIQIDDKQLATTTAKIMTQNGKEIANVRALQYTEQINKDAAISRFVIDVQRGNKEYLFRGASQTADIQTNIQNLFSIEQISAAAYKGFQISEVVMLKQPVQNLDISSFLFRGELKYTTLENLKSSLGMNIAARDVVRSNYEYIKYDYTPSLNVEFDNKMLISKSFLTGVSASLDKNLQVASLQKITGVELAKIETPQFEVFKPSTSTSRGLTSQAQTTQLSAPALNIETIKSAVQSSFPSAEISIPLTKLDVSKQIASVETKEIIKTDLRLSSIQMPKLIREEKPSVAVATKSFQISRSSQQQKNIQNIMSKQINVPAQITSPAISQKQISEQISETIQIQKIVSTPKTTISTPSMSFNYVPMTIKLSKFERYEMTRLKETFKFERPNFRFETYKPSLFAQTFKIERPNFNEIFRPIVKQSRRRKK